MLGFDPNLDHFLGVPMLFPNKSSRFGTMQPAEIRGNSMGKNCFFNSLILLFPPIHNFDMNLCSTYSTIVPRLT